MWYGGFLVSVVDCWLSVTSEFAIALSLLPLIGLVACRLRLAVGGCILRKVSLVGRHT